MNQLNCPICNSPMITRNHRGEWYLRLRAYQTLFRCKFCSHAWRAPLLENDSEITNRYELESGLVRYGDYTANSDGSVPVHLIQRAKMIKKGQSILDFGSGDGSFLQYMRLKGLDAWGVDLDTSAIKSEELLKYIKSNVSDYGIVQFDYIHANHVIEHVASPVTILLLLSRQMKPSGLIVIEVPCELKSLSNFFKQLIGIRSRSATSLYEHQHFFSPESLRLLLIKSGFIPIKIETPWRIKNGIRGMLDFVASRINKGEVICAVAYKDSKENKI